MGLTERTIRGSAWEVGSSITAQLLQFCITIVMARLLSPDDFGVFNMSLIFVIFLQIFSQFGMGAAVVQRKGLSEAHLSSVFWANVALGVLLCFLFVFCAPFIADFFKVAELRNIIYVLSLVFIVNSVASLQRNLLIKHMRFKKLAIVNVSSLVLSGSLGIYLAINKYGAWSLVWAFVSQSLLSVLIIWSTSEWKPKIMFYWEKVKELLGFSFNVLGFDLINYFARNIQNILIGRYMTAASLGYYSMANRVMILPLQHITWRLSAVLFPALSEVQDDLETVRNAYKKILFCISIITFPIMMGLIIVAPELVVVVIGEKWRPVIFLLQVLCVSGLMQSIGATSGSIMLSQGRADVQFKWGLFGCTVICAAIAIGLNWGLKGVALFYTGAMIFLTPILMFIVIRLIRMAFKDLMISLLPASVSSGLMFLCLAVFRFFFSPFSHFPLIAILFIYTLLGVALYFLFLQIFFRTRLNEIKTVLINVLFKRASNLK